MLLHILGIQGKEKGDEYSKTVGLSMDGWRPTNLFDKYQSARVGEGNTRAQVFLAIMNEGTNS